MPERDIVVIGGSAGALEALTTIVSELTPELRACVIVVVHAGPESASVLHEILGRVTELPVEAVTARRPITMGRIYVSVPDFHLLVFPDLVRATHGPRENGYRPAIDALFRTAAHAYGDRVIGIVLSGALDDGTYGLEVVKEAGGLAVVQDPADATIPTMPLSAMDNVDVDHVLSAAAIAELLVRTCGQPVEGEVAMGRNHHGDDDVEVQIPGQSVEVDEMEALHGPPSGLTCPDCGGSLWEIDEGRLKRYKCHVGHQYSPDSLLAEQSDAVESALWTAVRTLEEQVELRTRMADRADAAGLTNVSEGFSERARESHQQAELIRRVLFTRDRQTAALASARTEAANHPKRRPKKTVRHR
jgi:two-component system chemotaxis response regulator CheB